MGSGYSDSYADRRGVLTHEFGHAIGIAHYNYGWGPYPYWQEADTPTMHVDDYGFGSSVTYYFRTLEDSDKSSKEDLDDEIN